MKLLAFKRTSDSIPFALLRERDNFGFREIDLMGPPRRFWSDGAQEPPLLEQGVDARRVTEVPLPSTLLGSLPDGDTWSAQTKRSLERMRAWFLLCEDPQRRLDAQRVSTLAHQASLVSHILSTPALDRVLIADEVGLGKTVEAGLIIRELLSGQPTLRVLYLAPARLVRNVRHEFERLGLAFRQWVAGDDRDANLTDPHIIASIHRAALSGNQEEFLETAAWDVIVVDECHHLSDWEKGGGSPRRNYLLVRELIKKQREGGRVVLMSGTPHQGHPDRFENLLALLRRDPEPASALAGRVIYRTKDDVRDWEGHPLFPSRQVNHPVILDLSPEHRNWIENIHDLYVPPNDDAGRQGRRRAAGWRCAQALQWAASSVQAGLGYLVRQALRADWKLSDPALREAVGMLRPYRLGPAEESIEDLYQRLQREVDRQKGADDVDDIESEEGEDQWRPDAVLLESLLREGSALVRESGDEKWRLVFDRLLRPIGDEKAVLFAQPIETVTHFARFLERETGQKPALIIGNQSEDDRQSEVDGFWRLDGPQFLVSSRAGGEGINLQVARRLVHLDVPWNPMDLEQRVGRVHRFGSRRTVIVDTVVTRDSRESDAYQVARRKLEEIARVLVAPERFESLFSRVMSLVPPAELQAILNERPLAPLTSEETQRLAELVREGFDTWRQFDTRFGEKQKELKAVDPGHASWRDVQELCETHLGARPVNGISALRFRFEGNEIREARADADAVCLADGSVLACGDFSGMPVTSPDGQQVGLLGLNLPTVCETLRRIAFPELPSGAAHIRWPKGVAPVGGMQPPFGVLVASRQSLRFGGGSSPLEFAASLHVNVVTRESSTVTLDGDDRATMVRTLLRGTVRLQPADEAELMRAITEAEPDFLTELRRPSERDREERIQHAVTPLLAAVVTPAM